MDKRLSASAPKPRSLFPFPGYPTVAAAGLYLCLSGGCSRDPGSTSNTGGTTSTGGATSTGGTTSTGGQLAGNPASPFDDHPTSAEDASAANVPAPDPAVPDATDTSSPTDASEADLAANEPAPPDPAGIP